MDEIAKTYNYRVLISDGSGTIVYSSEGEKSLMYKSLWNILNENLDKISPTYIVNCPDNLALVWILSIGVLMITV